MDLDLIDDKIQKSKGYKFFLKHRKLMIFIEGLFVIGLLISINIYFYNDWKIKEQIRDNCGYTSNDWTCVCNKDALDLYMGKGINLTLDSSRSLDAQNMQNDKLAG